MNQKVSKVDRINQAFLYFRVTKDTMFDFK